MELVVGGSLSLSLSLCRRLLSRGDAVCESSSNYRIKIEKPFSAPTATSLLYP